jgi:hypothetical protein
MVTPPGRACLQLDSSVSVETTPALYDSRESRSACRSPVRGAESHRSTTVPRIREYQAEWPTWSARADTLPVQRRQDTLRYLRQLGWLDALAGVLVLAGAALSAAKGAIGSLSPWLNVALIVAGVVVPVLAHGLAWLKRQRADEQSRARLLRIRRPVREIDPFEEGLVFSSAIAEKYRGPDGRLPYVTRDVDAELDRKLTSRPFVLITGMSQAGKSRSAFEAVGRVVPEPTLLVPQSPEALPDLIEPANFPDLRGRPAVLWLDELDRYLELSATKPLAEPLKVLSKHAPRVVVLATLTLTEYDRLRHGEGEIGRTAREILDYARDREITLSSEESPDEKERALKAYPGERFEAGIAAHFAAAGELVARFKTGLEAEPHGFAVALAALDWRRTGMTRPINEEELAAFYKVCLKRFHPLLEPRDYSAGRDWARTPVTSRAALLMPQQAANGPGGFQIFDYIRDWADRADPDVDARLREPGQQSWRFVASVQHLRNWSPWQSPPTRAASRWLRKRGSVRWTPATPTSRRWLPSTSASSSKSRASWRRPAPPISRPSTPATPASRPWPLST